MSDAQTVIGQASSAAAIRAASRPISTGRFRDQIRATSQLVAGILHEFNTPLGALRSAIDTARNALGRLREAIEHDPDRARQLTDQMDEVLLIARQATDRIVDTVDALSHFARVDRSDIDEVDLGALVDTVVRLTGVARRGRVKLTSSVPQGLRVRCRVREIEHVLYQLLRNAAQVLAGRKGAAIDVTVSQLPSGMAEISVQDNGPGIAQAEISTLFEPVLTTRGRTVGLGLDLLACRYIAEEHGGSLQAENVPTGGARFTLRFREPPT